MNTIEKLDRLAELQAAPDAIRLQKQALIDSILTDEIKAQLAEIDAEFAEPLRAAQLAADELSDEIKAEVLETGATVKGSHIMAVWAKGRTSWDGKKLDGMMILIPQLKDARKEGEPTVSFRRV
jgi:hypothetical protein